MTRELGAAGRRARAHRLSRARLRAPARAALAVWEMGLCLSFFVPRRARRSHTRQTAAAVRRQPSHEAGPAAAPARRRSAEPESRDEKLEKVQSRHARDSRSEQSQLFSCSLFILCRVL